MAGIRHQGPAGRDKPESQQITAIWHFQPRGEGMPSGVSFTVSFSWPDVLVLYPLMEQMTRDRSRMYVMMLGTLTAVVVIFTQLFLYEGTRETPDTEVRTENATDGPSGEKVLISAPQPSVLSSFHAGINHEAVFLFEILFDCREHKGWAPEVPVSLGKYFLTLFRTIISPNAP